MRDSLDSWRESISVKELTYLQIKPLLQSLMMTVSSTSDSHTTIHLCLKLTNQYANAKVALPSVHTAQAAVEVTSLACQLT